VKTIEENNMNKTLSLALATACFAVVASPAVLAQDEDKGPSFPPLETFTCNYNDGKGPADLEAAVDQWTAYMDESGGDQYFAMTMTPQMHGADTFDVAWLGAAPTAELMGAGRDSYRADGGETAAGFASVLTCDTHSQFATMVVKEPPERETPNSLVLSFSDCDVEEGREWDEVFAGMEAWATHQAEKGYGNGTWVLFPAYGGADQDFDFKMLNAYDNHAGMGRDFDLYTTGGGYMKRGEIMGDMIDCDVARVYDGTVRRQIREEE
jgi:hypothetical protein